MSVIERTVTLAFTFCVACGGARSSEPESPATVEQHRQAAAEEDRAAAEHEAQYAQGRHEEQGVPNSELWFGVEVYDPSEFHWREAREARRRAAQHRAAAEELESYEERECGRFPPGTRTQCALLSVVEVRDVPNGVALELVEGVNTEAVADHIRCHIAFAAARGRDRIAHCPLYVDGVAVQVDDEGLLLLTTNAGDDVVDELRERAHWMAGEGE